MKPSAALRLLPLVLLATACASAPPPTLYLLTAKAPAAAAETPRPAKQRVIALGPVTVPDYLDRTDMVRRATDDRLDVSDSERWAETLRAGFQRVLVADLANRLGPGDWVTGGGRGGLPDVELPVDVESFERDASGRVVLTASWEIRPAAGDRTPLRQRKTYSRVPAPGDTESQVRALSANIDDLAADLAAGLGSGPGTGRK